MATTKHNHGPNFGRKVDGCPRCEELKSGAEPVQGWGQKKQLELARLRKEIREHDCQKSGCGPVCTKFEW